jgi:hypothetical protein
MVTNSTNINKTINHLSPQTIENKENTDIWQWKSITVNQLIFAAIMFRVFLLQDSFAEI